MTKASRKQILVSRLKYQDRLPGVVGFLILTFNHAKRDE